MVFTFEEPMEMKYAKIRLKQSIFKIHIIPASYKRGEACGTNFEHVLLHVSEFTKSK